MYWFDEILIFPVLMIELKQFLSSVNSGLSQRYSLNEGAGKLPPPVPPEAQWVRQGGSS